MQFYNWFTPATKAEAQTEAETEESLRSSVNVENGDGSTSGCSTEAETEGTDRSIFFCFCQAYFANFELRTSNDGSVTGNGRMSRLRKIMKF